MLRILPFGASIVWGAASSDLNGFRGRLRTLLVGNGASVNYVGEVQNGDMADNDVSGFPGAKIAGLAAPLEHALPWRPNLIIIHVGTNDAATDDHVDTAHERLGAMLDRIISALPQTVILLSNLIINRDPVNEARIGIINANLPAMVKERIDRGGLVHLVDLHSLLTTSDFPANDITHPNDGGYAKMANGFYSAIQEIYAKCWLTPPASVTGVDDSVPTLIADVIPGNTKGPNKVQQGSGSDDGIYTHQSDPLGQANIHTTRSGVGYHISDVYWADINGYHSAQELGVALSDGSGANGFGGTNGYVNFAIPMNCPLGSLTHFGDIDGDGRDDWICISGRDGTLSAWRNTPGADPRQPKVSVPTISNQGYLVQMADIDGDGKVDYLTIGFDGSYTAWRNGGVGVPKFWQAMGVVFNEGGDLAWQHFRLVDINGDGRADVLWVSNTGAVTTWTNIRGETLNSLAPIWRSAGVTHSGVGTGVTTYSQVIFGNVKGHKEWETWPNYQGVGVDYTVLFNSAEGFPLPAGETSTEGLVVKLWFNKGTGGGTRQAGDGVRYCDMRGTGSDDYIWVAKDGAITVFGNYHTPPFWLQYGEAFNPGERLMQGHTRKDIHLADLNGDGKCDWLIVDKKSGSVRMIRNDYSSSTDKFAWTDLGIIFDGGGCPHHHGVGLFDLGVRFADITGNGFPDYLCIAPDGITTAWINTNMNFVALGQAKAPVGADRANLRYADINGDGKADLIWSDKYDGTYLVWTNEGPGNPADNLGSYIHWNARGFSGGGGNLRGECNNWSE
ncbi:hypothetical protein B0O99DRAFT_530303 [Bisporella sp. PMI_857]|nr:hypothetical protein B0O99DRAFT_530303 [Bisporella sp. PMI_857]